MNTLIHKNIPLTLYLKLFRKCYERVMCERWVGDWTETATYWPALPPSLVALLSRSAGLLNRRAWELVLTASNCNSWLQTNWTFCGTGLYHCLTSTCFMWASHLHPIQHVHSQGYTLLSSMGCTCSLIDGWVGGQYVTMDLAGSVWRKALRDQLLRFNFKIQKNYT